MPYNSNHIYEPLSFEELEYRLFVAYNLGLQSLGIPEVSFNIWRTSNAKHVYYTSLEISLNSEILTAGLQNQMVKSVSSLVLNVERGDTPLGLYNALMKVGCTDVAIRTPNTTVDATDPAYFKLALDYPETVTSKMIWDCLAENVGCGGFTDGGDIEYTDNLIYTTFTFNWKNFANTPLKVKLYIDYSTNTTINRITFDQVKANYVARFNEYYKAGANIEPAYLNDISYYPSLSYINSKFSVDDGVTWLDLNAVLESTYDTKYTVIETNINVYDPANPDPDETVANKKVKNG